jgi:hypothetical protein
MFDRLSSPCMPPTKYNYMSPVICVVNSTKSCIHARPFCRQNSQCTENVLPAIRYYRRRFTGWTCAYIRRSEKVQGINILGSRSQVLFRTVRSSKSACDGEPTGREIIGRSNSMVNIVSARGSFLRRLCGSRYYCIIERFMLLITCSV